MARKTKAPLAAEAAEAEALAAAEADDNPEELDALLEAGYEAADDEDGDWELTEDDLAELRDADEAGGFDAFAAKVVITCTKVERKTGGDSGNAYLNLTWVVQGGEHAKANIWDIVMLQGKGVGFAKRKLNQLGLSLNGLKKSDLEGLTVEAVTKIDRAKKDSGYDDKTVIKSYGAHVTVDGEAEDVDLPE